MKHLHLLTGLVLLAAAACNDDEQTAQGGAGTVLTAPVELTAAIVPMEEVRTAAAAWSDGDRIGLYMFRHGTLRVVGSARNAEYEAAASGALTPAGEAARFASDCKEYDFFAYYPYRAELAENTLPIDLRDQSDPAATCLMYSDNASAVKEQTEAVQLEFRHKLTKLSFGLVPGAGITKAELAGIAATVEGLDAEADFNVLTGRIQHRRNPAAVAATTAADGTSAALVSLPGERLNFKLHFTLRDGRTFDWETDRTFTLQEGKIHTFAVTIGNSGVEVTPGDIADWGDADDGPTTGKGEPIAPAAVYAVGDLYPDAEHAEGVVYEVTEDGKHGKVVSLDEYKHRWGSYPKVEATDGVPEAVNADDGSKATRNLIAIRHTAGNFATDYAIFHWLHTAKNGSDAEGAWYLPARNELRALLAAASGLIYADIADAWTDDAAMPQLAATQSARDAFNAILTGAGGTKLNLWGTYWSATEIDGEHAWCVKFDTGTMVKDKFKYDEWGPTARPIRAF